MHALEFEDARVPWTQEEVLSVSLSAVVIPLSIEQLKNTLVEL